MFALFMTLVCLVGFMIVLNARSTVSNLGVRRSDRLPQKGKATMFDVRHLLMEGEKDLAVQLYCEIFNTSTTIALKDIEELERSLRV